MSFKAPALGEAAGDVSKLTQLLQLAFDSLENEQRKLDPIGQIQLWPGQYEVPEGWLEANGGTYNVTRYPELYARLGTAFGSGAGTFDVPDLSGSYPSDMMYIIRAE